jgi:hypothetical protein
MGDKQGHPFRGNQHTRFGTLLHGTASEFAEFDAGKTGHGLTYLSEVTAGRKTQAEYIAEGPFGGNLLEVELDESRMKLFDPYNDPAAAELIAGLTDPYNPGSKAVPYENAPDLVKRAAPLGYNVFEFIESSVQGKSVAVADPTLLRIKSRMKSGRKS